ncbi:MAG: peptide ABC transporter substrate-binding protein [Defluviitaleaceae bacterium]|nr:peptide ABC transporter substrate-binding protein [Defluviitaleaceae bacterium]MCL2835830.1 peptide ABC transporter substrate-binding protein [Defluviitaleaceae bacterium]
MRKCIALILAAAMLTGLLAGCAADGATAGTGEKVITMAMTNPWDTMMPLNTNSNYGRVIYDQLYDRLTMNQADGSFAPRLAKSWEVSEDSTAVTFRLVENAKWHDGTPFTSADVVFSFQLYSNPGVEALSRYLLQYIDGVDASGAEISDKSIAVEALDDYTVVITMKSPMYYETLLNDLNNVFMIPKHIFEGKTPEELNAPTLWENPVGTGAFRFASKIDGERMEFTANEDYFQGAPKIDRLVVRIIPTANLLAGLISGEIDILAGGGLGAILLDDWGMAKEQNNLITESIPTQSYQMLIINTQKPYMTERARQAFSMAINRDVLVNSLLQGEGVSIVTPISPISPYYNPAVEVWFDPDLAKQILEEENFPFDQELVFLVPTGNTTRERAAVLIQQDFQRIGANVRIQSVDFPTLMNDMREELHDFGVIGSGGSLDPSESRQMINPDSTVNFSRLTDYTLSDLALEGTSALTFETRVPYFNLYQELMRDTAAIVYLFTTNSLMAYNNRLTGINAANFNVLDWSAWKWDIN